MSEEMEKITVDYEAPQERIQYESERLVSQIKEQLVGQDVAYLHRLAPEIIEKSIPELQQAIQAGKFSYEDLTAFYLLRMLETDVLVGGLNAISEIHPQAIEQARKCDDQKATIDYNKYPLFGMPITFKENILTKDLATSAGTFAFKDFIPTEDAGVVKQLKAKGALVLGKTNLSELANFMDPTMPSGYSSKHGQTLNPYGPLVLSPLGSSSGSGSSIANNIGVVSIGSETTGSITAPAALQSLVGYKPSKQLFDETGVFPLSSSLDVVGPLSRKMLDAILVHNACTKGKKVNLETLSSFTLKNLRIGLVASDHPLQEKLKQTLQALEVTVVDVAFDEQDIDNLQIINQELARDFAAFTKAYHYPIQSLAALIEYNKQDLPRRARYGQRLIEESATYTKPDTTFVANQIQLAQQRLNDLRTQYQLTAFVSFNYEKVLLPAVAGYPELTIPFGQVDGEPQGATFIGFKEEDATLLQIGYAFEQATKLRVLQS